MTAPGDAQGPAVRGPEPYFLIRDEYRRRGERIAELEAQVAELTKTVADCGICRLGSRTIHINDDCPRHGDTDGEGP